MRRSRVEIRPLVVNKMMIALLGVATSTSWAAPSAPSLDGWTRTDDRDATIYAPADRRDIELRLHAPASSPQAVATWFAHRVMQPPASIRGIKIAKTEVQQGVHVAMASARRANSEVVVVLVGCRRPDGLVYGELIAPPDREVFQRYATPALAFAIQQCLSAEPQPRERPQPTADASAARSIASELDTLGFRLDARFVGATYTYFLKPVLLFKGGDTTEDLGVLALGLTEHKRAHPGAWSRWRRVGSTFERSTGGRWERLRMEVMRPFAGGAWLAGRYHASSSTTSPGGAYASWSELAFERGGRFQSGAGTGGASNSSRGSTASRSARVPRAGSYELAGYLLTLRFDDGTIEHHTVARDPSKPAQIYIDGTTYTSS
jgi:hypothetical protein